MPSSIAKPIRPSHRMTRHFCLLLLSLACGVTALTATTDAGCLPVTISADNRYLVGCDKRPWLVHGDTAWSLLAALTTEEAERYLEDRRRHGINAVIVNLIEHKFAPAAPRNRAGDAPFLSPTDFSTPNEAYFRHADRILKLAGEKGILVFLFPCYWGYDGKNEGFWHELIANDAAQCRAYGRFLGQRYRSFTNIVWVHGGDFSPPDDSPGVALGLEILLGIKDRDRPGRMHSFHGKRSTTALDHHRFAPHLDLDSIYTGDEFVQRGPAEPWRLSLHAYNRANHRPAFLVEARYENEAQTNPVLIVIGARERIRRQPYCALLSGAMGHFLGNDAVWQFKAGWDGPRGIHSPANADLVHFREVFATRAWEKLVPDQAHQTVVAHYGAPNALDYVVAARAADGSLVIGYVPSTGTESRTISVDLSRLSGTVNGLWFNPTSGTCTTVKGSPFANVGVREFATPGDNGTGTNDWALILESVPAR